MLHVSAPLYIVEINRFFTHRHSIYSRVKRVKYFASEASEESEHRLNIKCSSSLDMSKFTKTSPQVNFAYLPIHSWILFSRFRITNFGPYSHGLHFDGKLLQKQFNPNIPRCTCKKERS